MTGVRDEAVAIAPELTKLRRALHAEPEIGLDLPRTQRKVLDALEGLPLEITLGEGLSSVTAVLRGATAGPTVLLRGDMDALPVTERTDVAYASTIDGAMHACGHDLHTAMLAGAARLLSARQGEIAGNVIFMFQPGEEGPGGARIMVSEGVLDAGRRAAGSRLRPARGVRPAAVRPAREPGGHDHGGRRHTAGDGARPGRARLAAAPRG